MRSIWHYTILAFLILITFNFFKSNFQDSLKPVNSKNVPRVRRISVNWDTAYFQGLHFKLFALAKKWEKKVNKDLLKSKRSYDILQNCLEVHFLEIITKSRISGSLYRNNIMIDVLPSHQICGLKVDLITWLEKYCAFSKSEFIKSD